MKLMVEANSLYEIRKLITLNNVEIVMVGIDFLSLECHKQEMNVLEKIVKLIHHHKKKIALDMERIYHEDDFTFIKMLIQNNTIKTIDYYVYSDLGIYQLIIEMGLAKKGIYRANTYLTNAKDVSIFQKLNQYVVASNQITSDELINLSNNVQSNLIIDAFGMGCCFYSRRPLLSNYLKFKNILDKHYTNTVLKLQEETRDNYYHFIEDYNGVRIYEENYYALTDELSKVKCEYLLLHHFNLKNNVFVKIVSLYNDYLNQAFNEITLEEALNTLGIKIGKGAYGFKTVLLKGESNNE